MEIVEGKNLVEDPKAQEDNEENFFVLKQILGRTWNAKEQRHLYKVQWEDLSTGKFLSALLCLKMIILLQFLIQQYLVSLVSLFRCNCFY